MAKFRLLGLAVARAILLIASVGAEAALVSARGGDVGAFSGGVQQVNGTLTAVGPAHGANKADVRRHVFRGPVAAARPVVRSTSPWRQGQSVAYGGEFYLPANFHVATTGQQALVGIGQPPRAATGS